MTELIFKKDVSEYNINILIPDNDNIIMSLDTGSPITILCIKHLLQITEEPLSVLLNKIEDALNKNCYIGFGVYGSQEHGIGRKFIPYLLKDIKIGSNKINFFLVWLDITNYNNETEVTSALFGFDYIKQGKKWFDEEDNFHIKFDKNFRLDILGLDGALCNYSDKILSLNEIKKLSEIKVNKSDKNSEKVFKDFFTKKNRR